MKKANDSVVPASVSSIKDNRANVGKGAKGRSSRLSDPYGTPALHVRRPGSDIAEVHPTPGWYCFNYSVFNQIAKDKLGDDPYQTEMDNFIDTVRFPSIF